MSKKKSYSEGTFFCVPISNGSYCIGIIARIDDSIILGYFLKKIFEYVPPLEEIIFLFRNNKSNFYIEKFGSLGLDKGVWIQLGILDSWSRKDWPVPDFKRRILNSEKYFIVKYDDNLQYLSEYVTDFSQEIDLLPDDGTSGYVFLEKKLFKLFN